MGKSIVLHIGINECVCNRLTLYSCDFREKNKRFAEQGAALVCLCAEGLEKIENLIKDGSILQSLDS